MQSPSADKVELFRKRVIKSCHATITVRHHHIRVRLDPSLRHHRTLEVHILKASMKSEKTSIDDHHS